MVSGNVQVKWWMWGNNVNCKLCLEKRKLLLSQSKLYMLISCLLTLSYLIELCLPSIQTSTCMWGLRPTFWAKTRRSHAPSALLPTSTTYARTSQKTTGSMVLSHTHINTLSAFKTCYCFPSNLPTSPLIQRASLCPLDGYWHSSVDETAHLFI